MTSTDIMNSNKNGATSASFDTTINESQNQLDHIVQLSLPLISSPTQNQTSIEEIQLRDYQQETYEEILAHWRYIKRILVQQPTGAGKSLIMASLTRDFHQRSEPVLVIVHKVELLRQAIAHLKRWLGEDASIGVIADRSQFKRNPDAQIQVASIQALNYIKSEKLPPASLVVIDEAHHCHAKSFARIFGHYQEAYFLGLTATPMRLDGRGLRYLFDGVQGFEALVTGVAVRELIEREYLADFKFFTSAELLDPSAAGVHSRAGDYKLEELEDYVEETLLYGDVVETWQKHAENKRTVVYPVSVKYSQELCLEFVEAGYKAEHLDAFTKAKEREAILERFKSGETLILCQHSIVIEGVDVPGIEAVVFARPTKSLTIWGQAIGRALRPAPGKDHAIIIDHTTTHHQLPFPDDEIEWSLDPISLDPGTKHALDCPVCHHVFRPTKVELDREWASCPSCTTKFEFKVGHGSNPKPPKVVRILPADFNLLDLQPLNPEVSANVDRLLEFQASKGYKPSWVYYRFKELALNKEIPIPSLWDFKALAKKLGYKPGWGYYKHKELLAEIQQLELLELSTFPEGVIDM